MKEINNYKRGKVFLAVILPAKDNYICLNRENFYPALPPIDLMYLASIAERAGYDAKIFDGNVDNDFYNELIQYSPNFIIADIKLKTYKAEMEILAKVKQMLPSVKIIVKGTPFFTYNNNVTYENPFIDYAVLGEPEKTIKDILEGVPSCEIGGICYTDENMQAQKNDKNCFIENLDVLPFPARHLINNKNYIYKRKLQTPIEVSRGCPYYCFHCLSTPLSGAEVRYRSVSSIVIELKECIEKYNIKHFVFLSDIFNSKPEWIKELCKRIIDEKLNITWSSSIFPNYIDDETASLMHKSGCKYCYINAISGSNLVLQCINKDIDIEKIKNVTEVLNRNKIKAYANFIVGFPPETEETVNDTIKFALKLKCDGINFETPIPIPGTKFFIYSILNRLITEKINFDSGPIVKTIKLSKKQILKLKKYAEKKYFFHSKYIINNVIKLIILKLKNLHKA